MAIEKLNKDTVIDFFGSKTSRDILQKFNNFEKQLTIKTNLDIDNYEILSEQESSKHHEKLNMPDHSDEQSTMSL